MKKRIIIFMPSIEGGGVEKNLFIIANYLSKKVGNINLITISNKYKKKFNKFINFISLSSKFWDNMSRRTKYFLAIILLIREILKDRNTVVFSFQANIYCIIICKIFSIKIISRSNTAPAGWSKNPFKRIIFKIFLKLSDKIMVNSYQFKKDLKKELGVNSVCIYNPLNTSEILKKSKNKSQKIFKSKDRLRILNMGRFTDQKDQITILKALNKLKEKINFEAAIIGKGVLKEKLQKYIDNQNLNDQIKIKNFTKNPYSAIKQTELFILSSKFEGLPNVLLESLVLKKFIISSNCPTGPKEILLNGQGGLLFNIGNYKELEKRIIFYNENKKKCLKKLNISIKKLNRFDYKKNLNEYVKLVKSIR
tara:strand:- start:675 stop:1769 length:1095 start_codon:yes stop_codon:yes gene_type:complete